MVRSRRARRLLPKLPGTPGPVDWPDLRVGHVDTGFTEHPVFGDWTTGAVWVCTPDGLNLREGGADAHHPLECEGNPGHSTRTCRPQERGRDTDYPFSRIRRSFSRFQSRSLIEARLS
jgi:hypothetical protein